MSTPRFMTGRRWLAAAALLLVAGGLVYWRRSGASSAESGAVFATRRGPLEITVLEGGSLQSLESQEIKCEVRVGYQGTKILKIVEEGYLVTEEDVRTNKVLVELDSSEIQKQVVQQEIQFEQAAATLTDAQQGYDIQLNQNLSDIKAAEQKARFARLDFDKFLGADAAETVVQGLEVEKPPSSTLPTFAPAGSPGSAGSPTNAPVAPVDPSPRPAPKGPVVDFSRFAKLEALGDGEAKQKLRKLLDDHQVAQKELEQARATLEGTRRLFGGGYVTRTDLQRDEIAYENSRLKVQTAETARDLFLKYELIKTAEETLSKYSEALRELDRARKAAVSKLAQAEAKLRSSQAQYTVQERQKKEFTEQQEKCVIHATKPGLVVYGGGNDQYYYGGEERIREGATVRERQAIITIPDMTRMTVKVSIHESYIKKVKKGQRVRITADAFPDKQLTGEVSKVAVLPDSQNRWMNPDLKVYVTTITVDGTQDWLKPGMTAKAEIQVDRLADVLYVPVQAITPIDGRQYCYVSGGRSPGRREVEIGQFNDEFIEIRKGVSEGELVLLRQPPQESGEGAGKGGPAAAGSPAAGQKAAPAAAASAPKS
ncbi:MAG TPA: hypothetical protein DCM86_03295 [Verrucomicrobiales bacterium]|nr:hypothetical protein [Verrucomicrobiales bacterium]